MGRSTAVKRRSPLGGGIIIPVPNTPKENVTEQSGKRRTSYRPPGFDRDNLIGTVLSSGIVGGGGRGSAPRSITASSKPAPGSDPNIIYGPDDRPIGYRDDRFDPRKPSATMETKRVNVQDPTLGGPPEREVPIPRERRQRISRRSDPRGRAPFSPNERGMARDRFFERMFNRSEERRQQKSMEREERDNVRDSLRSERDLRRSEEAGPSDERAGEGRRMRRRRDGGRRRRRGRRRDFTRRRSRMEGGRRGRSGREMAAFRDRYVSTLGSNFFS